MPSLAARWPQFFRSCWGVAQVSSPSPGSRGYCLGGSPVISNLRSRAKPVPRATVFSAPSTASPARTPRTVGWHSSSVRESVASQIRTSASSPQTRAPPSSAPSTCSGSSPAPLRQPHPCSGSADGCSPGPAARTPGSLRSVRDKPDRPTRAFPRRAIDRAAPPNRLRWPPGTSGEWMLDQVRKHRLPIVGTGAAVWSFIHVDDVATATLAAVEDGDPGIYNIVDDEPATVSEWLPELARIVHAKPPIRIPVWIARFAVAQAGVILMSEARGASNQKAKSRLGWEPRWRTWRDGFRHEVELEQRRVAA